MAGPRAHPSHTSPTHTPTHDLPTYTQATRHDELPSPSSSSGRHKSLSDSQGAKEEVSLPEIPTLEVYRPQLETIESVPEDTAVASGKGSSNEQTETGASSTNKHAEVGKGSPNVQAKTGKESPNERVGSGKGSSTTKVTNEAVVEQSIEEQPNQSIDFAREVRCGTSTPIEDNRFVDVEDGSRTFDPDATGGGLVTLETVEIELSVEVDETTDEEKAVNVD